MKLTIATDEKRFFRQALEILSGFPPLDTLRNRELDLLAAVMYYNYIYRNLDEDIRWRVINNKTTKKELRELIDMNEDVYNNNMSIIKKTGVIDKSGRLATMLQIIPGEVYKIEFTFNIERDVFGG